MSKNNEFINFSKNLRQTSTGVKFARQLYTDPNKFSPRQITMILRELGLDIPKDVQLTADVAQIVVSGGAISRGYEAAQTLQGAEQAKNVQSLNNLSEGTARAATGLFEQQGWIERDQASMINVGISVAMLVASGGTDISSWVALAMEIGITGSATQAEATMLAARRNINIYKNNISIEARNLQHAANKLNRGQIGIFGFLAETSLTSSMLFDQCILQNPKLKFIQDMIPGLNFLPRYLITQRNEASETTWYGEEKSGSHELSYTRIGQVKNITEAANMIFNYGFLPLVKPYVDIEKQIREQKKVSFQDYVKLIALDNKNFVFDSSLDIQNKLRRQMLTPSDLGVDLFSNVDDAEIKSKALSGIFSLVDKQTSIEQVKNADKNGYINTVLKNHKARSILEKSFYYGQIKIDNKQKNLSDFIAMMDLVDLIKKDPFYIFSDMTKLDRTYIDQFMIFDIDSWTKEMGMLQSVSTIRKVNFLAKQNIASYLNTNVNKLIRINPASADQAGIYRIGK